MTPNISKHLVVKVRRPISRKRKSGNFHRRPADYRTVDLSYLYKIKKPVKVCFVCGFGETSGGSAQFFGGELARRKLNEKIKPDYIGILNPHDFVLKWLSALIRSNSILVFPRGIKIKKWLRTRPDMMKKLSQATIIEVPYSELGFFDDSNNVNYLLFRIQKALKQQTKKKK